MPRTARLRISLSALLLLGATACGGGDSPSGPQTGTPVVGTVTVTPGTATLTAAGATASLAAEVRLSNGSLGTQTASWSSSSPNVATVSGGTVTAVASGTTTITATVGTVTGTATVTVAIPTVQTITVNPSTATLTAAGQTTALAAEVRLSNGAVGTQTPGWASSNTAVATVSAAGVVTAVASGTTNVTATIGTVSGTAAVTVAIPTVQTITVTPATSTLVSLGATTSLAAEVRMSNGTVGTATPVWNSSNPAVATVSGGTVTAVGNGTANITATVGSVVGTAAVTVAQAVASVRLLPADTVVKTAATLRGAALDARGNVIAGAPLQWTSSNTGVATVNAAGVLTPLNPGVVRVQVSSGASSATAVMRSIANITRLSDMNPLFEYTASAGQRRAHSDVSQSHADARAVIMGQVWAYLETILPTSGSPTTDMYFTTWTEIWQEAIPFCGGFLFPNQDIWQQCNTPTVSQWFVSGVSPNDFMLISRFLTRQWLLASMTRVFEFPWFLAGYPMYLTGGAFEGATLVGAPSRGLILDFRTGDSQNLLVPLDTLMRTPNARYFENLPQRTPVAVRSAQAALFIAFLQRDYPTVIPAILARIRATPGATVTNDMLLQDITTLTGRTIEQLDAAYLVYARSLQP